MAIPGLPGPAAGQPQPAYGVSFPSMYELPPILVAPRVVSAPRTLMSNGVSDTMFEVRLRACAPSSVPADPSDATRKSGTFKFPIRVTRTREVAPCDVYVLLVESTRPTGIVFQLALRQSVANVRFIPYSAAAMALDCSCWLRAIRPCCIEAKKIPAMRVPITTIAKMATARAKPSRRCAIRRITSPSSCVARQPYEANPHSVH